MWLLVGLGNPGPQYDKTRHNVGFDLIDRLSEQWKIPVDQKGPAFLFGTGDFSDCPVALVKPLTFMNRSGAAVARLLREEEFEPAQTLIVYDEVQLPLGRIRLRKRGSHGGHNGLRSVIASVGSEEIPRLRIGIGEPRGDMVDYVLSRFSSQERETIDDALIDAVAAVETLVREGAETAMNRFNR